MNNIYYVYLDPTKKIDNEFGYEPFYVGKGKNKRMESITKNGFNFKTNAKTWLIKNTTTKEIHTMLLYINNVQIRYRT